MWDIFMEKWGLLFWRMGKKQNEWLRKNLIILIQGILKFETGNQYHGQFRNGSMEGFGEFIWTSGKSYSGFYCKDIKEGLGLLYNCEPLEIYFGYWVKGQRDGPAVLINNHGKYYSIWDAGKQIKIFANKQEGVNYINSSPNLCRKYKKFYFLNLEELIKTFTKRKEYISGELFK